MQNIYTVQYFVFYILPLVIFVKKVVYHREMMGEYLVGLVGVEILIFWKFIFCKKGILCDIVELYTQIQFYGG